MKRRVVWLSSAATAAALLAPVAGAGLGVGPDVVYSDCTSVNQWGELGGIRAYSLGTSTCNMGDENLLWGSMNSGTPVVGFNAYRLHDGRLMQIGMSWAKSGTGAAAGSGCGIPCNGEGGSVLGVGCRDVYNATFNGFQGILKARSVVNPFTGAMAPAPGGSGSVIDRRLQVQTSDLAPDSFPGALYFVEGVYVGIDDAPAGNFLNNASYKRVVIDAAFDMGVVGSMEIGTPAILAWRDHGNGVNTPDPDVAIEIADVPGEGRFYVASKVTSNGDSTWHYEYAIFNLTSNRAGGSLRVPLSSGITATNVGFHDVDYHSGEVYDNTDWVASAGSSSLKWASTQTFSENPNANALRWGTMYNFWYDANAGPTPGGASMGLFVPGTPSSLVVPVPVPGVPCPWDCGDGNAIVGINDLLELIEGWGAPGPCDIVDGDGVGVRDLLDLLSNWGPCK